MSVIFLNPNSILRSSIAKLIISVPTMSSSKIIAEYAKSNRSSCKKCSTSIDNKSLRLGSVSRDPRGFDSTKWYHLHCLPLNSTSVDSIAGFTSLKVTITHFKCIIIINRFCFLLYSYLLYLHRLVIRLL